MLVETENVTHLADRLHVDGGFTWSPARDIPTKGYMISAKGSEVKVPLGEFRTRDIAWYLSVFDDILCEDGPFLGAWIDAGTVYLDRSYCVADRDLALKLAAWEEQLAVWDIANGREIRLDALARPEAEK